MSEHTYPKLIKPIASLFMPRGPIMCNTINQKMCYQTIMIDVP